MFNGLFNEQHGCHEQEPCCGNFFGGCNCTWILLVILFLCCGGKMGKLSVTISPTCLILMIALLVCCGGLTFGKECR